MQDKSYTRTFPSGAKILQPPKLGEIEANKAILLAAYNGDFEKLNHLLKDNQWPNSELKKFILIYLLDKESMIKSVGKPGILNKHDVFKCLVQKGANIDDVLFSPLDFETIKAIEAGGGDLTHSRFEYTTLHAVVLTKSNISNPNWRDQITYLLQKGVDPNKKSSFGTALHGAIVNQSFDTKEKYPVEKYLITCLSQYPYDWNIQNHEGKTPLILAANVRSSELVELIAKIEKGINLDTQDHQGRTALHFSCALGDLDSAKALIEAGAAIELRDKEGKSPYDYTKLDEVSLQKLLREVSIDPKRDKNAMNNHIIDGLYRPIIVNKNGVSAPLLSQKEDWDKFSPDIIAKLKTIPYRSEMLRQQDIQYFEVQGKLSGKPLIKA